MTSHVDFPEELNVEARRIVFRTIDLESAIIATGIIILFAAVFFINSLSLTVLEKTLIALICMFFLGAACLFLAKYVFESEERQLANLAEEKGVVQSS